jgi:hypothetical protein
MDSFHIGDRVRLTGEPTPIGTVASYTVEEIEADRSVFLLVRWNGSGAVSPPVRDSRFRRAYD